VGSNTAKAMSFKGDKNPHHTYFGGEVKPEVPCCKILWHVKELYKCEGNTS
jgi:hypothetical protein